MMEPRQTDVLDLSDAKQAAFIVGARDIAPVSGLTHGFYKYPARFSPAFVRAVIETFTRRGDLVLDPYVGGGTTLVEAFAMGRDAIGVDISSLAEFVTRVKTTIYSDTELDALRTWSRRVPNIVSNAVKAKGEPTEFPISPTLLDEMTDDLRKIATHLNYRHSRRPMPKSPLVLTFLDNILRAPWRYKHPVPPKAPSKKAEDRPPRKRDPEPPPQP